MTYEQKGKTNTDKGHDMFVFHRVPSGWAAVLRLILCDCRQRQPRTLFMP